jgi:hypothetical protein
MDVKKNSDNFQTIQKGGLSQMQKSKHLRQPFFCFFVLVKKKSLTGIKKSMTKKDCEESFF